MFYGSNVWDPWLIIAQIVSVQCLFYTSLGCIQALTLGPILGYITIAYTFDWATLHFSTKLGALNWMAHVLNAFAGAAALAWVVERAKKCLDFGATCYFWHAVFVVWYSGWPRAFSWWSANLIGLVVMVLVGEWLCVRRELQDIPLSIPQRLGERLSSGLLSRGRKESGQVVVPMMPLPTDDPDQQRPRLRAGLSTLQRSSAAAAAAATAAIGAFASSSAFSSVTPTGAAVVNTAASPSQLPPAAARPGGAVQMSLLSAGGAGGGSPGGAGGSNANSSSSTGVQLSGSSFSSRKKLLARPASQTSMKQQQQQGGGSGSPMGVVANGVAAAPAAAGVSSNSEVQPA